MNSNTDVHRVTAFQNDESTGTGDSYPGDQVGKQAHVRKIGFAGE